MRGLRDAEVGHEHVAALVEQHVVRLDVAVHDVVGVGVGERVGDLARDPRGVADRQLLMAFQEVAERWAVDAPHDDVEDLLLPADLVDRHDVRMLEPCDGLRFAQKALGDGRGGGELDVEDLDRDIAIQGVVAGAEDGCKAPLTQQRANSKFLSERLLQALLEGFEVHGGGKR